MVSNYYLDQMYHNDLFGSIGHLNRPALWLNGCLSLCPGARAVWWQRTLFM